MSRSSSTSTSRAAGVRSSYGPSATATSTSWTGRPARCSRRPPSRTSTPPAAWISRRAASPSTTKRRRCSARSCATYAPPRPAPRTGSRRRGRFLRHHGSLVQGRARAHRRAALAVPDRLGDHRPAHHLSRPRRQAVRRRPRRRRRLGGRHRLRRPGCTRSVRGRRLRQRDARPAAAHAPRRHPLGLCAAVNTALAGLLVVLVAGGTTAAAPSALRVCADPNNLPFSNARGEGFENRLAELLARELRARLEYTWPAQRRG